MSDGRVHIRRGRRTDFTAVMRLLAASGVTVPVPDRATLRRFRQLVADLGGDFYLALVDDAVVGLVHVAYARQLAAPPSARLDQLVVVPTARRRGIASALLAFVEERAQRRGCSAFTCIVPDADAVARAFLGRAGMAADGQCFVKPLRD